MHAIVVRLEMWRCTPEWKYIAPHTFVVKLANPRDWLDVKRKNLVNLLQFHRQVHTTTGSAMSWNIKFYVAGVANVPRLWIDRCIKQPSKPISNGNKRIERTRAHGETKNIATHYACRCEIERLKVPPHDVQLFWEECFIVKSFW